MAAHGLLKAGDKPEATTGSHRLVVIATEAANLEKDKASVSTASASSLPAENVADMMRKLNLTPREAEPFVLDDEGDDLPCPEWALIGRIMAPNILHVQTITAVVRPAWGNPKGMQIRPMGPNLFLAEFSSEIDRQRVMTGGPWKLSKHAILLKTFDPKIEPMDVVFDQLYIWARIMRPGFNLMNSERGGPLAAKLGQVEKLDVDENGRAWGSFLRARVIINPTEPIMRWITCFSKSKNETILFEVMYERMPMFCFSCGLLGHSSLVCPTPAERDSEGKLPWHGEKICVPEVRNRGPESDQSNKGSWSGADQSSASRSAAPTGSNQKGTGEVASPMNKPVRNRKKPAAAADDAHVLGQKRKQAKVYRVKN
jgi:hypothetical protein